MAVLLAKAINKSGTLFDDIDQRYSGLSRPEVIFVAVFEFLAAGLALKTAVIQVDIPETEGSFEVPARRQNPLVAVGESQSIPVTPVT